MAVAPPEPYPQRRQRGVSVEHEKSLRKVKIIAVKVPLESVLFVVLWRSDR